MYDYIIVGSGVAGNVMSYLLQKQGFKTVILEKEINRKEKICGGGIPWKALKVLKDIGMDLAPLFKMDISIIKGHNTYIEGKCKTYIYDDNKYAIGCKRCIFDEYLLNQALLKGADIVWGSNVKSINDLKLITYKYNLSISNVILAVGARGLNGKYTKGQSIGISAQIKGYSKLRNDLFHFYYYSNKNDRYFWIFPIGENLWNVGIWQMNPDKEIKKDFWKCWNDYIKRNFKNYSIIKKPESEFCGNVDLNQYFENILGIGDYRGCNNKKNGGGIYKAIKSAIIFDNNLIENINCSTLSRKVCK